MHRQSSVRILVVDDSESWRRWLCSEISKQGRMHVVGEASDGLEALQTAELLKPDLVLLDIGLPKLNGLAAAQRISEVCPEAKVLFVSTQTDGDVVTKALSNGALGYVVKANAANELLSAIESVLRGERFVSRRIK